MPSHWELEHGVLHVTLQGRLVEEDVAAIDAAVQAALQVDDGVSVILDRRRMGAPTPEGRRALEAWAETRLPLLAERCVAWADVLSAHVVASLDRRRRAQGGPADDAPRGCPQRIFTDTVAALAWVHDRRAAAQV